MFFTDIQSVLQILLPPVTTTQRSFPARLLQGSRNALQRLPDSALNELALQEACQEELPNFAPDLLIPDVVNPRQGKSLPLPLVELLYVFRKFVVAILSESCAVC